MRTVRLRVTLREVDPRVLRVVDVPASSTLPELHELLQVAVGWTVSHRHQFVAGGVRYGVPDEEWPDDQVDEAGLRLRGLPERFVYQRAPARVALNHARSVTAWCRASEAWGQHGVEHRGRTDYRRLR